MVSPRPYGLLTRMDLTYPLPRRLKEDLFDYELSILVVNRPDFGQ
jgi:hypothetical protein